MGSSIIETQLKVLAGNVNPHHTLHFKRGIINDPLGSLLHILFSDFDYI